MTPAAKAKEYKKIITGYLFGKKRATIEPLNRTSTFYGIINFS